jgi:hypothetical protein
MKRVGPAEGLLATALIIIEWSAVAIEWAVRRLATIFAASFKISALSRS